MNRLVVLTQGTPYADKVMSALRQANVPVAAIVFQVHPSVCAVDWRARPIEALRRTIIGRKARPRLAAWQVPWWDEWRACQTAPAILNGGELNSASFVAAVADTTPDYLLLLGAGIISPQVIALAKRGALNVHPGLLPWCRGVGVVERAVERGIAIGVTGHYVNPGIDRGDMLMRRLLPIERNDTLATIRARADTSCIEMMTDLAIQAARNELGPGAPQRTKHPYCRFPSEYELATIRDLVAQGRALQLYTQWRSHFGGDLLPEGVEIGPPAETVS